MQKSAAIKSEEIAERNEKEEFLHIYLNNR